MSSYEVIFYATGHYDHDFVVAVPGESLLRCGCDAIPKRLSLLLKVLEHVVAG